MSEEMPFGSVFSAQEDREGSGSPPVKILKWVSAGGGPAMLCRAICRGQSRPGVAVVHTD